jgi:hypothetical protein
MESTDEAGKVRLSEAVCRQLEEEFELEPRGLIESKAKVKRPLGSWSGKKHCFLGPLISRISSGFSPLARFSRLAAAAFSMSPYGEVPTGAYKPLPNLKRYTSRKGWEISILVLRSLMNFALAGNRRNASKRTRHVGQRQI